MSFQVTRVGDQINISLKPGADGSFAWIDGLHHDFEGALRAFRYLAQKAAASYAVGDPKTKKVVDSIEKHLGTLERLKTSLIDPVFPLER